MYQSNLEDPRNFYATQCNPNEPFAILLHGWRESCNTTWMKQLIGSKCSFNRIIIAVMNYEVVNRGFSISILVFHSFIYFKFIIFAHFYNKIKTFV